MSSTANKLEVSHLSGYMGVTEKIKRAMYDVAKQFVYIGFLLWEVQEYGYYREAGYQDVYEYAAQELGFKKSSVKNFIAISYQFGCADHRAINGCSHVRTMSLQQPYEKFQYSQLCEMLSMSEKQRELVTPDMTVKQIRELKKELKKEPEAEQITIDDLESAGQTSGQTQTKSELSWIDASKQVPSNTDQSIKIVAIDCGFYRTVSLGFYIAAKKQWKDIYGKSIKVLHWMNTPKIP